MIAVFIEEAGQIEVAKEIDPSLENLQSIVGGYIETVAITNNLVVICDEEGAINGKKINMELGGITFYGTLIFAGYDGEEFTDCTEARHVINLIEDVKRANLEADL